MPNDSQRVHQPMSQVPSQQPQTPPNYSGYTGYTGYSGTPIGSIPQPGQMVAPTLQRPAPHYQAGDRVAAWCCLILGWLLTKSVLQLGGGFPLTVFCLGTLAIITVLPLLHHAKITLPSILFLAVMGVFSLSFLVTSNGYSNAASFWLLFFGGLYWLVTINANRSQARLGEMLPFDLLKSVFVMPFGSFGNLFGGLFRPNPATPQPLQSMQTGVPGQPLAAQMVQMAQRAPKKHHKPSPKFWWAVLGVLIALIPTAIIISLLSSADAAFHNLIVWLRNNLHIDFGWLFNQLGFLLLGLPVAMYLFGALYSNIHHRYPKQLCAFRNQHTISALRFAPKALVFGAATPPLLVYLLFFFSQSAYYLSAFSSILPNGTSYANYAREGFFQLCTVAVINLLLIGAITVFCRRDDGKKPVPVRVYNSLLSVFTLALIAIAFSKMALYIQRFGLTQKRVLTAWLMVLLAFVMLFLLFKQCFDRFRLAQASVIATVVMVGVLAFGNMDLQIARYNVAAYQAGQLKEMDISQFYDMSEDTVTAILPLLDSTGNDANGNDVAAAARNFVENTARRIGDKKPYAYTLATLHAKKALTQAGFTIPSPADRDR